MLTLTRAERAVNTPSDTGWEKFARAVPRVVAPNIKRALKKRCSIATAEQAARIWQLEKLEAKIEELAREIIDAAESLRDMRRALLDRQAAE